MIYHSMLIILAACELRWRAAWLRLLLVVLTVAELQVAMGLGPAYRRAVANPRRVEMPRPPSRPPTLASDFVSGVLVMDEEARRVLTRGNFPLGILIWLSLYPVVLPAITRRLRRPRSPEHTPLEGAPRGS